VIHKNRPEWNKKIKEKWLHIEGEDNLRNHRDRLSLAKVKIVLDNPLGLYLPYENLCQRFDLKCPKNSVDSRVNRGADFHDE
jgi:hypothetical protein